MSSSDNRLPVIDTLRALASQLIVLHHLAFYGPMSDSALELAPDLIAWLSDYARLAVQVFLVLGGFFAAKALAPAGKLIADRPVAVLAKRYLRLVLPYAVALLAAMAGAFVARAWMQHDSVPSPPQARQFLAHVLLLHNVLGYDALSAGAWYVAIDFQLFALLLGALWLGQRLGGGLGAVRWPVTVLAAASLFHFNRDPDLDMFGLYFFGSYALGAAAWWASSRERAPWRFAALALVTVLALVIDFRSRIAVALATACLLVLAQRIKSRPDWMRSTLIQGLSRISYAVFLVHFPVCLVANAAFSAFMPDDARVQAIGMGIAWAASIVFGALFHRFVEQPSQAWAGKLLPVLRQRPNWSAR